MSNFANFHQRVANKLVGVPARANILEMCLSFENALPRNALRWCLRGIGRATAVDAHGDRRRGRATLRATWVSVQMLSPYEPAASAYDSGVIWLIETNDPRIHAYQSYLANPTPKQPSAS